MPHSQSGLLTAWRPALQEHHLSSRRYLVALAGVSLQAINSAVRKGQENERDSIRNLGLFSHCPKEGWLPRTP
jgi:hypothetical protein